MLKQEGTVKEYWRRFEVLAASLLTIPEDVLEEILINGLKASIMIEVRMLKSRRLDHIMALV